MKSRKHLLRQFICCLVLLSVILLASGVAYACPNCKAGLSTSDPQAKNMAAGYYYSILFMLSMPFLIVTSFGSWMYFAVRKAKAEREVNAVVNESMDDKANEVSTVSSGHDVSL